MEALNIEGKKELTEQEKRERRKNMMAGIRDAILSDDV